MNTLYSHHPRQDFHHLGKPSVHSITAPLLFLPLKQGSDFYSRSLVLPVLEFRVTEIMCVATFFCLVFLFTHHNSEIHSWCRGGYFGFVVLLSLLHELTMLLTFIYFIGCFDFSQFGTIMNKVSMNIILCEHMFSFLLSIYLELQSLGHMGKCMINENIL